MRLSVVIPALDESTNVATAIERTRELGKVEIVVVDGGSTDDTLEHATGADLVIESERGRARQMNAGAAAAGGDVLLFLHADCWVEPDGGEAMRAALADVRVVGGCFRHAIDDDGWLYRWIERGDDLRARCWQWVYGDQGLFVRRRVFEELGGFPDEPLMEDLLFAKRLRRTGRIAVLEPRIHSSSRRWRRRGVVRQTLHNWSLLARLHLGVPPARLAESYAKIR